VAALSGVAGTSLWIVEPAHVVENLKRSSYIESAAVSLALPDQLHITVVERQPSIRWSVQGTEYLVDENALVLGAAAGPSENALVVIDTFRGTLAAGEKLDADALELARALSLRLPQEASLTPRRIEWDIFYGILVITENEQKIAFGRKDDAKVSLDEKIATLRSVIDQGMQFQFLDLRPGVPYLVEPTPPPPPPEEPE
jgi:cell division septal protein FtsQ